MVVSHGDTYDSFACTVLVKRNELQRGDSHRILPSLHGNYNSITRFDRAIVGVNWQTLIIALHETVNHILGSDCYPLLDRAKNFVSLLFYPAYV